MQKKLYDIAQFVLARSIIIIIIIITIGQLFDDVILLLQPELTTPENTITYHNVLCLSPQNFAQALSSVSLRS